MVNKKPVYKILAVRILYLIFVSFQPCTFYGLNAGQCRRTQIWKEFGSSVCVARNILPRLLVLCHILEITPAVLTKNRPHWHCWSSKDSPFLFFSYLTRNWEARHLALHSVASLLLLHLKTFWGWNLNRMILGTFYFCNYLWQM